MRLLFVPLITLIITGCDGSYRYPCQDPANWGKIECNNEVCKAEGTCTSDVLAPAGTRELGLTTNPQSTENSLEETESEISNDTCNKTSDDNVKPIDFRVKRIEVRPSDENVMDPEGDEYEAPARTPASMEEQPVSLNSTVDATEHDKATK